LRIAYELKEELREIYLAQYNGENGIEKVKKMAKFCSDYFGKSREKIERHLNGIANYRAPVV